ncbi:MAG: winged helix-turn-helix domain-containing protein [Alphaproteobacteria bacterium]|nr:winged helix-turn-helix domain-containing protein [Alphaproteobacteria bacterium]
MQTPASLAGRVDRPTSAIPATALEFGRFRVLLRQRQLLADGVPVELGTRAFDLLLALLESDGQLITKEELIGRVWPDVVISEENLKVQVSILRKALGGGRDLIRTEFGRGYRFTGMLRSIAPDSCQRPVRANPRSGPALFPQAFWRSLPCRSGCSGRQ